jgi:1,4-alpha-glucan branching enzyme
VLLEQLADDLIKDHFVEYINQEIEGATADIERFEKANDTHFLYLAHFYLDWYRQILHTFLERFDRDLVGGFRRLQDAGMVEILTSAATHPYLPLMQRDSTIAAQLAIGKRTTERHFGKSPRAIWLPECAYRPAYYARSSDGAPYQRLGIESWLETQGLRLFFSESSAVEGSRVIGEARRSTREIMRENASRQEVLDIYGQVESVIEQMGYESAGFVTDKHVIPFEGEQQAAGSADGTNVPYLVRDSDVSVLGRNREVGEQVWAAAIGYPGDSKYREFHKKDAEHGLQYWRVTDSNIDIAYKEPYDPFQAGQRVEEHANHFVGQVKQQLAAFQQTHVTPGVIASA